MPHSFSCKTCGSNDVSVHVTGSSGYGLLACVQVNCHECYRLSHERDKEYEAETVCVGWDSECVDCGCDMIAAESYTHDDSGNIIPICRRCDLIREHTDDEALEALGMK